MLHLVVPRKILKWCDEKRGERSRVEFIVDMLVKLSKEDAKG